MKPKSKKDYYTTQELSQAEWFPIKSGITIKKLIESGALEAVDISTSADRKRYRVSRESAESFVERRKSGKN
jgi:hypothetical protein